MQRLFFILIFLFTASTASADKTIVQYGFDSKLPSAADGFLVFENTRGFVEPTSDEKFSGYRSLEIKEDALDNGFVELQGVFAPITTGDVLFHFAFQVRNPEEELNIAIAGPQHFYLKKDGIFFWLKTINGNLHHHADGIPKKIGKLEPSTWYVADAVLHIDKGTYDLRIVNAKDRSLFILAKDQLNATRSPGSAISKLSFIGDLEDRSTVDYYVDDVELRTLSSPLVLDDSFSKSKNSDRSLSSQGGDDRAHITTAEPSNPRKGFLEEYKELKKLVLERPLCLPATELEDFGLTRESLQTFDAEKKEEISLSIKSDDKSIPSIGSLRSNEAKSIVTWRNGCISLAAGQFQTAVRLHKEALELSPKMPLSRAALTMTYLALKNQMEAEYQLSILYKTWATDARLPVLLGAVSRTFNGYDQAAEALRGVAQQMSEDRIKHQISTLIVGDDAGYDELKTSFETKWKEELDDLYIGQNYYFSLIFSDKVKEASVFAHTLVERYQNVPRAKYAWLEREADALALTGEIEKAKELYQKVKDNCTDCTSVNQRLVDLEYQ